jgi:hypothetical protein
MIFRTYLCGDTITRGKKEGGRRESKIERRFKCRSTRFGMAEVYTIAGKMASGVQDGGGKLHGHEPSSLLFPELAVTRIVRVQQPRVNLRLEGITVLSPKPRSKGSWLQRKPLVDKVFA